MSQGAVEKALGKLVTDDAFRERFFAGPAVASLTAGLVLSRVELDALSHLSQRALIEFSRRLDDRIRRLPVEAERQFAPTRRLDTDDDRSPTESYTRRGPAHAARAPRAGGARAPLKALRQAGGADPSESP
jgi:hypothetical protein